MSFQEADPIEYSFVELTPGQVPLDAREGYLLLEGFDICTGEKLVFMGSQREIESCVTGIPVIVAVPDYAIKCVEADSE